MAILVRANPMACRFSPVCFSRPAAYVRFGMSEKGNLRYSLATERACSFVRNTAASLTHPPDKDRDIGSFRILPQIVEKLALPIAFHMSCLSRVHASCTFVHPSPAESHSILSQKIIVPKGMPAEYPKDALRIAAAAVNGIEVAEDREEDCRGRGHTSAPRSARLKNCRNRQMKDPIAEEPRKRRMEHARKFQGDLSAICADLRAVQASFRARSPPKRVEPTDKPNQPRRPGR